MRHEGIRGSRSGELVFARKRIYDLNVDGYHDEIEI
jgi:hypothetical protein